MYLIYNMNESGFCPKSKKESVPLRRKFSKDCITPVVCGTHEIPVVLIVKT